MKRDNEIPDLALLTINNAISNPAIVSFIRKHRQNIKVVIVSDTPGTLKNSIRHFKYLYLKSGLFFSFFLAYCFFFYPYLAGIICNARSFFNLKNNNSTISGVCSEYNIQLLKTSNINDNHIVDLINNLQVDLLITCIFDQILKELIIKIPRLGCLNLHPGLLPECRGLFPEFHTAAGKCHAFGFTIHLIEDKTIDSGKILMKKIVDVQGSKNMLMIERKIISESLSALDELLEVIETLLNEARPQKDGNYYSYPSREDIKLIIKAGYKLLSAA